jgi:membrane-associated HD superfamily phosphohydrolase
MSVDDWLGPASSNRSVAYMRSQDIPWADRLRVLTIWALFLALVTIVLAAPLALGGQVRLQEGDVARTDVVAPRQVTYVSEILTQQRRESAANAVLDVYDPPQARIGRQQLTLANQVLDFIVTVRSDPQIDTPTKSAYLDAIAQVNLSPAVVGRILSLSGQAWERTAAEVQVVLERAMREEIRETSLSDEMRKVPARVRLDLPEAELPLSPKLCRICLFPTASTTQTGPRSVGNWRERVSNR